MSIAATLARNPLRQIIHRSLGHSHGYITRLMSPGDLGKILKPFVFLDLFDNQGDTFPTFGLHPHSGLATLTYVAEGSVSYEDTNGATGILRAGGVEWMRAGKGVWHSGGAGDPGLTRGFQLWVALPPHLELGVSESIYQSAADIPQAGPARLLLGHHDGAKSAIAAPSPINYLAVALKAGQGWRYQPPEGHTVLWLAMAKAVSARRTCWSTARSWSLRRDTDRSISSPRRMPSSSSDRLLRIPTIWRWAIIPSTRRQRPCKPARPISSIFATT